MKNKKIASRFKITFAIIIVLVIAFTSFVLIVITNSIELSPIFIHMASGALVGVIAVVGLALYKNIALHADVVSELAKGVAEGKSFGMPQLIDIDSEFDEIAKSIRAIGAELNRLKDADVAAQKQVLELTQDIEGINAGLGRLVAGDLRFGGGYGQRRENMQDLNTMARHLQSLQNDVAALANAIKTGNFNASISLSKFNGDWKKMSENLNDASNAMSSLIADTQEALGGLAKGNLSIKMNTSGSGEVARLKSSFNAASNALSKNVNDIHSALSSSRGKPNPSGEFPNDFAKIREAIIDLGNRMEQPKPEVSRVFPTQRSSAQNAATTETKTRPVGSTNRMSGAYKPKPTSKLGNVNDYLWNDFGKY